MRGLRSRRTWMRRQAEKYSSHTVCSTSRRTRTVEPSVQSDALQQRSRGGTTNDQPGVLPLQYSLGYTLTYHPTLQTDQPHVPATIQAAAQQQTEPPQQCSSRHPPDGAQQARRDPCNAATQYRNRWGRSLHGQGHHRHTTSNTSHLNTTEQRSTQQGARAREAATYRPRRATAGPDER